MGDPLEQQPSDSELAAWLNAGQKLAREAVTRFLAIEELDPGWSRVHDAERGALIDQLHQMGHLREARALVHRWLLGYRDRLAITPTRSAARRRHLWRCLADVVERTADQHLLETFWTSLSGLRPSPLEADTSSVLPLLGVPILNRFDLLETLLNSLDHPVGTLAIVDNSCGDQEMTSRLDALQRGGHPLIETIEVARPFRNLGVAGSWNHILTSFPEASIALLANNDIRFTPQAIRTALAALDPERACFAALLPPPRSFSAFIINHHTWNLIGLFDENFHPAYCEDIAYTEKIEDHQEVVSPELSDLQRAMSKYNPEQSATIASDEKLSRYNRNSFQLNRLWLLSKRRHNGDLRGAWLRRWLGEWSD